jgi:hypothetical protein
MSPVFTRLQLPSLETGESMTLALRTWRRQDLTCLLLLLKQFLSLFVDEECMRVLSSAGEMTQLMNHLPTALSCLLRADVGC